MYLFLGLLQLVVGDVLEMSPQDFPGYLASSSTPVVAMFHVSWCGACKRTLPEFKRVQFDPLALSFVAVDCTDDKSFAEANSISGFPALRVWTGETWVSIPHYQRDARGIVDFVNRVVGPDFVQESDIAALDHPPNGHLQSVVFKAVQGDYRGKTFAEWKTKFHFAEIEAGLFDEWLKSNGIIAPNAVAAVVSTAVVGEKKIFPFEKTSFFASPSFLPSAQFRGVWLLDEHRFQAFNDMGKFKVLLGTAGLEDEFIREAEQCEFSDFSEFAFGILHPVDRFADALVEFGITSDRPVLVLSNEPLEFSKFWTFELASLCSRLGAVRTAPAQYRGSWLGRTHRRYVDWMKLAGLGSEVWQVGLPMSLAGLAIWALIWWVSRGDREKQD